MSTTTLYLADNHAGRVAQRPVRMAGATPAALPVCAINREEGVHTLRPGMTMRWQNGGLCADTLASMAAHNVEAMCYVFALLDRSVPADEFTNGSTLGAVGWMVLVRRSSLGLLRERMHGVSFLLLVELSREVSGELFSQEDTEMPHASALEWREGELAFFPLTPAARLAVESVRRCPLAGACRMLVLSARCHDLLVEFISARQTRAMPVAALMTDTELRVREAGSTLARRLEETPSLEALAREAGLSETTLKRGFRQVFGTTVFEHLRRLRMERARELLRSGEATVIEAATLVGYSNPSNFAAAFRRQFGMNPKEFQLAARR